MTETYVQLTCPNCGKDWERAPSDLPHPERDFTCPDCGERRPMAEFARTKRDLETLEQLS